MNWYSVANCAIAAKQERHRIRSLGLLRGDQYVATDDGKATIETGDKLLLLGRARDLRAFGDTL